MRILAISIPFFLCLFTTSTEAQIGADGTGTITNKKGTIYEIGPGKNLRQADLYGVNLSGANLADCDLYGADLQNSNLNGANLSGAELYFTKLDGAIITNADLSFAYCKKATFQNADLTDSKLPGVDFTDAILSNANFTRADLFSADLARVEASNTNFSNANLSDCEFLGDFTFANFTNAEIKSGVFHFPFIGSSILNGAIFINTDLSFAIMNRTTLIGANLKGANLYGANLTDADLSDTSLNGSNFKRAITENTIFSGATSGPVLNGRSSNLTLSVNAITQQTTISLQLEQSDDLKSWQPIGDTVTQVLDVPDGKKFLRFKLSK